MLGNSIVNKNRILKNSFYLLILNVINIISPMIVLPYLSRVLGVNNYGFLMYALSLSAICWIVTDFGFNLFGVYYVSKNRIDKVKLGKFIGAVYKIKVGLVVFSSLAVVLLFNLTDSISLSKNLVLLVCFNVLVQSLFLNWLFQGLEKMNLITVISAVAKLIYVVLTFSLVKEESDVELVLMLYCISNMITVIMSMFLISRMGIKIKFKSRKLYNVAIFFSSARFFYSRIAVSLYTSASTFLIGLFLGPQSVALYSSAEKIYQAAQSLTGVLSQAFFPFMVREKRSRLLFIVTFTIGTLLLIFCSIISIFSENLIEIIYGVQFVSASSVLNYFLVTIVVNFFGVSFGYPLFASINRLDVVNYSVIIGAVVYAIILMFFLFNNTFSIENVSIAVLAVETLVMCIRLLSYKIISRRVSV